MDEQVKELLRNIKHTCEGHEKSCEGCPFFINEKRGCIFGMMPYAWFDDDFE